MIHDIPNETIIYLQTPIKLTSKPQPEGKPIGMVANPNDRIGDSKDKIEQSEVLPAKQQEVVFNH